MNSWKLKFRNSHFVQGAKTRRKSILLTSLDKVQKFTNLHIKLRNILRNLNFPLIFYLIFIEDDYSSEK
jgi:hypothetical protein